MEKTLFYLFGSSLKFYTGYVHGIISKSGRSHVHIKRRLHLIDFLFDDDGHVVGYKIIPKSVCHKYRA